ncbi:MAG: hypothetical protein ACYC3I_20015 [Gemmataceae bacterium]
MQAPYQARRITKRRADEVKRTGVLGRSLLLDTFNGIIVVEPLESNLGDGEILSQQEADYEMQPVWHLGPKAILREARKRLGLEAEVEAGQLTSA